MITACERKCPFVIGLYYGRRKPTDLEFCNEFVADYQNVEQNGIQFQGEKLTVVMTAIICDAPARAMVKNIEGHSGYSGCERCVQRGVYINKVTFPEADHRTDQSFRNMLDENHHLGETPLSQLSLGMVSNFPLDYMHLVCLGVTRRLVRGFATPLAVMAARRDSKIVLLSFSGEAKVVPVQVFSVLRSVGLKVPGEVDALQRKPLRGMNCFDVRFTSEAARVRGVHVLEGVEGLKVTPYDSSVWVTVLHLPLDMSEQVVVRTLGRFGKVTGYEELEFLECMGVKTGTRRVRVELKSDIPSTLWANGHRAHVAYPGQPRTCWRCGLEGHEARLCRTSGVAAVYRLGIPWPSVKGISFATRVGKRAISPVYAQTAHTPREWLRAWLKRSRPLTPYHMMLLSSPQCPTLAPRWRLCSPFRVRPLPDRTCRDCQPAH
ncbi:hypothetical protein BSL78_28128 [Apostichopus japonicus]|uniref:CCHC-type domain-containing protein n=1 Tax=Stichopus japonicus TaxID=307972 RepID=A0A2G8JH23_STIJA|nr:hypothetical protein BSL78_28128 [Apostichopus japonicus]